MLLSLAAAPQCSGFMEDLCPNLGCFSQVYVFFGGALERDFAYCMIMMLRGTLLGIMFAAYPGHPIWVGFFVTGPGSANVALHLCHSVLLRLDGG